VQADDVNTLQRVLGVDAPAVIGNLTAVKRTGFRRIATAAACGDYVDHVIHGNSPSRPRPSAPPGQKSEKAGKKKSSGK
jgi:hypothetical protein